MILEMTNNFPINTIYSDLLFKMHYQSNSLFYNSKSSKTLCCQWQLNLIKNRSIKNYKSSHRKMFFIFCFTQTLRKNVKYQKINYREQVVHTCFSK